MAKKNKERTGLPSIGTHPFQSDENKEAAEEYWLRMKETIDEDALQQFLKFAIWSRDAIGWRGFGRVITSGKVDK